MGPPFVLSRLWNFLSPLDGASVREAHCEQASTAVRKASRLALQCAALKRHARRLSLQCASVREVHCAQATVVRLLTFESLKWKYSFATNSGLFMKLGSLL